MTHNIDVVLAERIIYDIFPNDEWKIKIIEEKIESEFICVGGQETIFFSEGCSIYLGRVNSNFGFEKVPFFHSRDKIIQIEQHNSKLLGNRFIQRLNQ